jgi:hypothetical protein
MFVPPLLILRTHTPLLMVHGCPPLLSIDMEACSICYIHTFIYTQYLKMISH